jgi:CRP/FNR family transcriptional regulator
MTAVILDAFQSVVTGVIVSADTLPSAARPDHPRAGQTPWNCRFAYVAAALRSAPALDADGVVWTCQLREEGAEPVFTRDTCARCHRWSLRNGDIATGWTCGAAQGIPSPASRIARREYPRGAVIVEEGAAADDLFTVLSGSVMLLKRNPAGRAVGIDICVAGNPLGAEWIMTRSTSVATAVAVERTVCVVTPRPIVQELLRVQPSLVRAVIAQSAEQERHLIDRIAVSSGSRVEARFAHLFLELSAAVGRSDRGRVVIRLPLLRHDLALLTGTTVETAIRVMSRWEKQQLVTTRPDGFVVHDCQALERIRT